MFDKGRQARGRIYMRRWGSVMNTDDFISKMGMWDWICPSSKEYGSNTYTIYLS